MGETTNAEEALASMKLREAVREARKPDIEYLDPDPENFKIADRNYEIKPFPLKKIKLLYKMQALDLTIEDDNALEAIADLISKIINEPDKNFLLDNLNIPMITRLFDIIGRVNMPKISEKKTAV